MTDDVRIRPLAPADRQVWLWLRSKLWTWHSIEELTKEVDSHLVEDGRWKIGAESVPFVVLVAEMTPREIVGFVEVSLRPYADGCRSSPVGYLEGWFVLPEHRRHGVGAALVRSAEDWARAHGCTEMASDTWVDNSASESAHRALGYTEVQRTIHFRRSLS